MATIFSGMGGSHSIVGPSSPEEPAFLPRSHILLPLLVTGPSQAAIHPPALVTASDLVPPVLTMIHSRADRCIDLNDHGQLRGRVTLGKEEAAGWPWSSPSPRATTSATSGRPRGRPAPSARPAAITSTPHRPGNRPGGGGDRERKHSVSHPGRSLSAGPMTLSTSSATRGPGPSSAGRAAATRRSPITWPS